MDTLMIVESPAKAKNRFKKAYVIREIKTYTKCYRCKFDQNKMGIL